MDPPTSADSDCEMLMFSPVFPQNSLTRSAPLTSDAQGRSGARFHTSYDKRYVVKTITSEDVAEMHNILKKYHQVQAAIPRCRLQGLESQKV